MHPKFRNCPVDIDIIASSDAVLSQEEKKQELP
jgi:hypothetical protein